ncbi:MAG: hypothetical protein RIK87_18495 [Fuerstiella sp.]
MSRFVSRLQTLVLAAAVVCTITASAADNILQVIPKDVLGAVVIANPEQAQAKLSELAAKLQLPLPDLVQMARQRSGVSEGLDTTGSIALVLGEPAAGSPFPTAVWYVATSDYRQLLTSVGADESDGKIASAMLNGQRMLLAARDGYALIADIGSRATLERCLEGDSSLATETEAMSHRIDGTDFYAVATPAGISTAKQGLLQGLAMIKMQVEQQSPNPGDITAALAVYETIFRAMDREFSHLMFGIRMEADSAIRIVKSGLLLPEGILSRTGRNTRPMPPEIMADLPAGPFIFAGGGTLPQNLAQDMMAWSIQMMKLYLHGTELTDEDMRQLTDAAAGLMGNMRSMFIVMGNTSDDAPMYGNTTLVIQVDDASTFLKNYEASILRMSEIMERSENPPFTYQVSRSSFQDHEILELQTDMSGFLQAQAVPQTRQMMKNMFGDAEKVMIYLAVADEHTVLGRYISREQLVEDLKRGRPEQSVKDQPEIAETLALLPGTAMGVGLWSPIGTFRMARQMMQTLQPAAAAAIPDFPDSPPVGMSLELSPQQFHVDIVLPPGLIDAIAEYARSLHGQAAP